MTEPWFINWISSVQQRLAGRFDQHIDTHVGRNDARGVAKSPDKPVSLHLLPDFFYQKPADFLPLSRPPASAVPVFHRAPGYTGCEGFHTADKEL